jgi:hypothetical protein
MPYLITFKEKSLKIMIKLLDSIKIMHTSFNYLNFFDLEVAFGSIAHSLIDGTFGPGNKIQTLELLKDKKYPGTNFRLKLCGNKISSIINVSIQNHAPKVNIMQN